MKKFEKLITFTVPCYNSEAYMRHCIDSILVGGDDVEILIVDDGSTKDRTGEIADEYEKKYPNIMANKNISCDGGYLFIDSDELKKNTLGVTYLK